MCGGILKEPPIAGATGSLISYEGALPTDPVGCCVHWQNSQGREIPPIYRPSSQRGSNNSRSLRHWADGTVRVVRLHQRGDRMRRPSQNGGRKATWNNRHRVVIDVCPKPKGALNLTPKGALRPPPTAATSPELFRWRVFPSTFKKGAKSGGPPDFPGRRNRS
jgi:hypothetical protein